jgi:hypothetical protein
MRLRRSVDFVVGLDLGQQQDHSAVAVLEPQRW